MSADLRFGDCIEGMANMSPETVHLTVSSPPFGALFVYSGKPEDVGNNADGVDMLASPFGLHLRFWAEQLFRVHRPGTIAALHIQQLIAFLNQHGFMGRRDFRGALVDVMSDAGWDWTGEIAISKNPQSVAQRQKLHSLLFVTGKRDARRLAPVMNDYVMIFRKPGEGEPVPCLYDRETNPGGWVTTEEWIRDAHGVWSDIREMDVLEGWRSGRDDGDEKHVCPLQLTVIRRMVRLYTNPGDTVLDPFMGIGSTAYVAVQEGRKAIGFELKESYHALSLRYVARASSDRVDGQVELFPTVPAA